MGVRNNPHAPPPCGATATKNSAPDGRLSSASSEDAPNVWSRLLKENSQWTLTTVDSSGDEVPALTPTRAIPRLCECAVAARAAFATLRARPLLPAVALVVFAACAALGLGLVDAAACAHENQRFETARATAEEALAWFADEFDKALAPLFALAQVVKHDAGLCGLANVIKSRGEEGAAPGWPVAEKELLLRDVRSVCNDPELEGRFAEIAESVKRDSGLGRVISGLRIAPQGVMCMIHPVINYEDYTHVATDDAGASVQPYYNGTKFLYNDWAWDKPSHIDVLRKTLQVQEAQENRITITGPFKMKSAAGDGTVLTETLFCTHLGVTVPNHTLTMIGEGRDDPPETHDSWGFVMGFVNWQYMVDQSDICTRFRNIGMVYTLNRTFEYEDRGNGQRKTQNDQIAWTPERHVSTTDTDARVQVKRVVNGDNWTLLAGYTGPTRPAYEPWAQLAVVATSAVIAVLLLATLVKNQQHKDLLYKMMPKEAIRKLNRGQTVVEKYPCVTIFFSDIVGFTSMAGKMQPIEVMGMLNALYVEFDKLCERHNCYKVETIGDAYMVVGGAPDRCSPTEAANKVALFALDALVCVKNFHTPDGSTINIRAGMASGPVVAGVVGSVMPRYCLFGDTVNLASRMESTSKKDKLQVCDLTADFLHEKFRVEERRDSKERAGIMVKGKGWRETWWLTGPLGGDTSKVTETARGVPLELALDGKEAWPSSAEAPPTQNWEMLGQDLFHSRSGESERMGRVVTILEYRLFELLSSKTGSKIITSQTEISQELSSLVCNISSLYNKVQFHSFEHACMVTISMNKLLDLSARARNRINYEGWYWTNEMICFAMVFVALIHDVGHLGMTNKMLVEQGYDLAVRYNNKSVAEFNSIDIAIDLLTNGEYPCLRAALFQSNEEMKAFFMIVRVAVSATDIASKESMDGCKELRACAFPADKTSKSEMKELTDYHAFKILTANNLDASGFDLAFKTSLCQNCSLIQHLIQAADIAHSMQSFETSLRWNYRLFKELHACFTSNLLPADPGSFWATGEVGFFDAYVQPLATGLSRITSCPGSDEILMLSNFAKTNQDQWARHGKQITEIMVKGVTSGQEEEATIDSILHECHLAAEKSVSFVGVYNRAA